MSRIPRRPRRILRSYRCDARATFVVDTAGRESRGYCFDHFHRSLDVPGFSTVRIVRTHHALDATPAPAGESLEPARNGDACEAEGRLVSGDS